MVCPKCSGKVRIIDNVNVDNDVYRKRRCVDCKHVFFTTEFEIEYEGVFRDEWNANYRMNDR